MRLQQIVLKEGRFWAYLPPNVSAAMISDFGSVGHLEPYTMAAEASNLQGQFMSRYLQHSSRSYALLPDVNAEPGDRWASGLAVPYCRIGRRLYYVLGSRDSEVDTIVDLRREIASANSRLNLVVLVTLPGPYQIPIGQALDSELLDPLVSGLDHILVEAFDGKSDLVWSRSRPNSRSKE